MKPAWEVVPLNEAQIEAAGEALARGFFEEPFTAWVFADPAERARLTPWHFSGAVRYGFRFGEVYTTAGKPEGAAVWLPPGEWETKPDRTREAGLSEGRSVLGIEIWTRFMGIFETVEAFHRRNLPESHWYLMVLGVDKARQGQGIGSALIAPVLARADVQGLPCYLDTFDVRNVPFYQRHGFEILTDEIEPTSGLRFWTFRRDPR